MSDELRRLAEAALADHRALKAERDELRETVRIQKQEADRDRADLVAANARLAACEEQLTTETAQLRKDFAAAHDDRIKEHKINAALRERITELETELKRDASERYIAQRIAALSDTAGPYAPDWHGQQAKEEAGDA
jgi:SMC interacting uncharacterized protein involved in chromosome segregation